MIVDEGVDFLRVLPNNSSLAVGGESLKGVISKMAGGNTMPYKQPTLPISDLASECCPGAVPIHASRLLSEVRPERIWVRLRGEKQENCSSSLLRRDSNVRYINPLCEVFAGAKSNVSTMRRTSARCMSISRASLSFSRTSINGLI